MNSMLFQGCCNTSCMVQKACQGNVSWQLQPLVLLGLRPLALHTWVWRHSFSLLCKSSQAGWRPSGRHVEGFTKDGWLESSQGLCWTASGLSQDFSHTLVMLSLVSGSTLCYLSYNNISGIVSVSINCSQQEVVTTQSWSRETRILNTQMMSMWYFRYLFIYLLFWVNFFPLTFAINTKKRHYNIYFHCHSEGFSVDWPDKIQDLPHRGKGWCGCMCLNPYQCEHWGRNMFHFSLCVPADASGNHHFFWILWEQRSNGYRWRSQWTDWIHHPV